MSGNQPSIILRVVPHECGDYGAKDGHAVNMSPCLPERGLTVASMLPTVSKR